jgi:hypothetical protein
MWVTGMSDENQYVDNVFIYSGLWFLIGGLFSLILFYDLPHKMATSFDNTFGLSKTQLSLNTKSK